MRNLSFYTSTYLQTRMEMYEKSVAKKQALEEDYETRLLKLQQERAKLLREYTKFREIEEYSTSIRQSMKDTTTNIATAGTTTAAGGARAGAGKRVDINSYQKNVNEYASIVDQLAAEYGIDPQIVANQMDEKIAGQMVESIVERFKENKVDAAVAQAKVLNNDLKDMDDTTRTKIVGMYNQLLDNHEIPKNFKLLPNSQVNPLLGELTQLPAGLAARGPQIKQSIEETTRTEFERGLVAEAERARTEYDPEIKAAVRADLDRIAEDMRYTKNLLDQSRANKLEFELGPGYRPFAGMFRNARAARGRLQAMQGMDPSQREVFGILYDYVNKGTPKYAVESNAYAVADKIQAADAADLLRQARLAAAPNSGITTSDIVQAYAQIRAAQNANKQTAGAVLTDVAEKETVKELEGIYGPQDPTGLILNQAVNLSGNQSDALRMLRDPRPLRELEETLNAQKLKEKGGSGGESGQLK